MPVSAGPASQTRTEFVDALDDRDGVHATATDEDGFQIFVDDEKVGLKIDLTGVGPAAFTRVSHMTGGVLYEGVFERERAGETDTHPDHE